MNVALSGQIMTGIAAVFLFLWVTGILDRGVKKFLALFPFDHEKALREERQRSDREWEVQRQRRLLEMADEFEAAPEHVKQRLQREAEMLGFRDSA